MTLFEDRCICGDWKNMHYKNGLCSVCDCLEFEVEKAVCTPCLAGEHCNEIGAFACACSCPNEWMRSYRNYSYHGLLDNRLSHFIWRKLFCRIRWHLWDEVLSSSSNDPSRRHYLSCDACGETVDIAPVQSCADDRRGQEELA